MERVLIITGGGRGIGRATSLLAAQRGYAVCINYVSDSAAAEGVKAEIEASGGKAIAVEGKFLFVKTLGQSDDLALLVANGGNAEPHGYEVTVLVVQLNA